MPHVVIVGDRESGKATFLSLLYATQVKSGSDASDAFRFHADVDSLDEISEAFEQLMSGSFPDSATKEGMRGITFHLGYRKAGARRPLSPPIARMGRRWLDRFALHPRPECRGRDVAVSPGQFPHERRLEGSPGERRDRHPGRQHKARTQDRGQDGRVDGSIRYGGGVAPVRRATIAAPRQPPTHPPDRRLLQV